MNPIHRHAHLVAVVSALALMQCGESNSEEQNASAQRAADAYCACVAPATKLPFAQMNRACEAEESRYKTAWAALPVRGRDPKAHRISEYQHECYRVLSDAKMAAMQAEQR